MDFRIADTFTDSLARLTGEEQKAVQESQDAAGITEGLLRIAVGLEAVKDITADLARGLEAS